MSENKLELICLSLNLGMMDLMVVLGFVEHSWWFCCLILDGSFGNHYVLCDVLVVVAHKVVEGVAGDPLEPVAENIMVLLLMVLLFLTWGFGMLAMNLHTVFQVVIGILEVCKWGLFHDLILRKVLS